ncbi:MAG: DsbC family protein [Burkholderiales bacterium]|nr:DsbC family protein [Burkholderiales bacterium]
MKDQNPAPFQPQHRESAIIGERLSGQPTQEDTPTKLLVELKEAAANFKERYPKTQVLGFSLTPIRGLFEATVGKEVVYFDKSARFIFTGRLLDIEKGIDLTDAKLREIRRVDIAKLPLNLAIKQVKGTGERQLVLFTDVDCPFSRKLAQTLENVDNVTIWTFLYPLTSIHPEAKAKSDAVWCQKDSIAALDATYKGAAVTPYTASPLCNSPVETIIRLGAELGIGGTPTLINGAGDRSAGAIPLDKLEAFISAGNQRKEQGIQK